MKKPTNLLNGMKKLPMLMGLILILVSGIFSAPVASASSLSVMPAGGNYAVGSTFDVSVFLNTRNQSINAINLEISFPPDKLQVVSPAVGNSIIGIYTTSPQFNNQTGRIKIVGGINNGINTPAGLVAKLSFRVIAPGSANVRILSSSQVLLNDGRGTDALSDINSALYTLRLDSEGGPAVELDPNQIYNDWFFDKVITLSWQPVEGATGYSYILTKSPHDIPDDIIDNENNIIVYRDLESGTYYFHIKALVGRNWGPTSHTLVQVDNTPPEPFMIDVWPGLVTANQQPRFRFRTSDQHSGIDYYEIKIVNLSDIGRSQESFFIPTGEEYSPESLDNGRYDVIVRAYDKAGNIQESVRRIQISNSPFRMFAAAGLFLSGDNILPWYLVFIFSIIIFVGLMFLSWKVRRRYRRMLNIIHHDLMTDEVKSKLSELEKYRNRYGKIISALLIGLFMAMPWLGAEAHVANFSSPQILSYPKSIKPGEFFYVTGKTSAPNSEVIIHLQDIHGGEVWQFSTESNDRGDWFYSHSDILEDGKYAVWVSGRYDNQQSPPSAQVEIVVERIALQLGSSVLTFSSLYSALALVFGLLSMFLLGLIAYYLIHHYRRHKHLLVELANAEKSINYGFIQLRHDLAAELALIQSQHQGQLPEEVAVRARQLNEDISHLEKLVDLEIAAAKTES